MRGPGQSLVEYAHKSVPSITLPKSGQTTSKHHTKH